MYTGDVLSCTSHSGTVRHTCPIKNGEGDGLFFTVRKDKTLYKPTRWRSEALGEIPEGITRPIKGSEKERQETDAFLIDNPQDYPVALCNIDRDGHTRNFSRLLKVDRHVHVVSVESNPAA